MSIRSMLNELKKFRRDDDWCSACMVVKFRSDDEPGRPEVCPVCGRGPGDPDYYHPDGTPKVREFVFHTYTPEEMAAIRAAEKPVGTAHEPEPRQPGPELPARRQEIIEAGLSTANGNGHNGNGHGC